jgi:hypothetical protein
LQEKRYWWSKASCFRARINASALLLCNALRRSVEQILDKAYAVFIYSIKV